jgi:hypothetical protein
MERFYMVYVEGASTPSKKYESLSEAEKEAERLCIKENKKTFILRSAIKFELQNVVRTDLSPLF